MPSVPIDDSAVKAAHFTLTESGEFAPTPFAQSHWGDDHLNGPAVVGLAARSLELDCGSPDFMPARLTVDLFRAARGVSTTVTIRVVRDGRRIRSVECDLAQEGRLVARATCGSGSFQGAAVPRDSPAVNVTGNVPSPVMLGLPRYSCTPPTSTR